MLRQTELYRAYSTCIYGCGHVIIDLKRIIVIKITILGRMGQYAHVKQYANITFPTNG